MDSNYHYNLRYDYQASASSISPVNLKLVFLNEVASPVFTKQKIIGKASNGENSPIKVILIDRNTKQRISSGPEASAKVKIVLLRGDYGGSTTKEFEKNIVVNWHKKKNILLGDLYVDLQNGCGMVGDIRIKHDKNSLKNVKFRLGAMVVDSSYEVEEAMSNPFEVKDSRNLPKCKKSLSLDDRVGKMINISNKGTGRVRARLESKNIRTVRNFLNMYSSNPQQLREICGIKGKKWESTINHAKRCLVGNVHVTSTSQNSSSLSSEDYDGGIEFDNNGYKPQPCEDDHFSIPMIEDSTFSTHDVEVCEAYFNVFEPCQANEDGERNFGWALIDNTSEGDVYRERCWG